jgi:hypothetical protein
MLVGQGQKRGTALFCHVVPHPGDAITDQLDAASPASIHLWSSLKSSGFPTLFPFTKIAGVPVTPREAPC